MNNQYTFGVGVNAFCIAMDQLVRIHIVKLTLLRRVRIMALSAAKVECKRFVCSLHVNTNGPHIDCVCYAMLRVKCM